MRYYKKSAMYPLTYIPTDKEHTHTMDFNFIDIHCASKKVPLLFLQ